MRGRGVGGVLKLAPLVLLVSGVGCSSMLNRKGIAHENLDQLRKGLHLSQVETLVGNRRVDECALADGDFKVCYKVYVRREKERKRQKRNRAVHGTMGALLAKGTRTGNTYASGIAAAGVGVLWLGAEAIMTTSELINLGQRKRFVHVRYDRHQLVQDFAVTHEEEEQPLLEGFVIDSTSIRATGPPSGDEALVMEWGKTRRLP